MLVLLLLFGGPVLVKKFLRGYFVGVDVYVFLTVGGRMYAYKNRKGIFGHEDQPLAMVPHEVLYSDHFEPYYTCVGSIAEHCFAAVIRIIEPGIMPVIATKMSAAVL